MMNNTFILSIVFFMVLFSSIAQCETGNLSEELVEKYWNHTGDLASYGNEVKKLPPDSIHLFLKSFMNTGHTKASEFTAIKLNCTFLANSDDFYPEKFQEIWELILNPETEFRLQDYVLKSMTGWAQDIDIEVTSQMIQKLGVMKSIELQLDGYYSFSKILSLKFSKACREKAQLECRKIESTASSNLNVFWDWVSTNESGENFNRYVVASTFAQFRKIFGESFDRDFELWLLKNSISVPFEIYLFDTLVIPPSGKELVMRRMETIQKKVAETPEYQTREISESIEKVVEKFK